MMRLLSYCINYFSWAEGRSYFKRNSAEISVEFQILEYFLKFRVRDRLGRVPVFQTGLYTRCLTGP